MVALPPVSHVVRIDWHFVFGGDNNAQCRAFFQYTGALSQADANTWVGVAASAWVNRMLPQQTSDLSLNSTVLTDLSSATSPQATSGTTGAGGIVGNAMGAGTAVVIKRKVSRRYRGGHARLYMPAPSDGQLSTAQLWAPAYVAAINTAWTNLVSDIVNGVPVAAAPAFEVNVSYFQGFTNHTYPSGRIRPVPNPRGTPLVDLVVSHAVNGKVASQRRRNLQSA